MVNVSLKAFDDSPSGYCPCCSSIMTVGRWTLISRKPNNCFRLKDARWKRSRRGLTEREPFRSYKAKRGVCFTPSGHWIGDPNYGTSINRRFR